MILNKTHTYRCTQDSAIDYFRCLETNVIYTALDIPISVGTRINLRHGSHVAIFKVLRFEKEEFNNRITYLKLTCEKLYSSNGVIDFAAKQKAQTNKMSLKDYVIQFRKRQARLKEEKERKEKNRRLRFQYSGDRRK